MPEPEKDDSGRITVPKFSSFKTGVPAASAPSVQSPRRKRESERGQRNDRDDSERHQDTSERKERDRSRRDRRSEDTPSQQTRRDHHGHKRPQPASGRTSPEPKRLHVSKAENEVGVAGLYMLDNKGDPLLRKYGNNVHYFVPTYDRYPPGKIIGSEGRLFIHRDGQREQFSILQPGERADFIRHKDGLRSRWPRSRRNFVKLRASKHVQAEDYGDQTFLQVGKRKKRRQAGRSDSGSSDDEHHPSYRSIEGKMKVKQGTDDDESSDDSDESTDIHQDNPLRWRSVQLNRQVTEHPQDIDAWLELVDHQDALVKAGLDMEKTTTEEELRSYGEIKVSLLQSALSNAQTGPDRQRVLVLLMREGSRIWDRKTAAKKWAEVSEEERNSFDLWKAHVNFLMSEVATFQYDNMKNLFLARLRHLIDISATSGSNTMFAEAIYVFLRFTRMVADAGYKELAISAWQALFELNLFRPSSTEGAAPFLESLRDFWESEAPRFGESGARGWRHFVETDGSDEPLETPPLAPSGEGEIVSRDPYKLWAAEEQKQSTQARVPARTLDEANVDDPFRVVMFSDIEDMIFALPLDVLAELKEQLVDAFLIFSGLPPLTTSNRWTRMALQDPFAVAASGLERARETHDESSQSSDEVLKRLPMFKGRMLECSMTLDVLFPTHNWFHYLPQAETDALVPWIMVENSLRSLLTLGTGRDLCEYLLALVGSRDAANTKKQAKAQLKQYPTRISLYVSYALAESRNNKPEVAEKTLASAAELANGRDLAMVIQAWTWIKLDGRQKGPALRVLCSAADAELRKDLGRSEPPSSAQLLKASQFFESEAHTSFYLGSSEAAALYGACSMLLSYLTSSETIEPVSAAQGSISAAMTLVDSLSKEFCMRHLGQTAGHEQILQAAARLLYWHVANGPFRRFYMGQQTTKFVRAFPTNTIFLSLLEWSDSGLRVIDETRQLLHDESLIPSLDCLSIRVFAIQHEIAHGNVNSTRAAFEHAVTSDVGRASVLIWVWYIEFAYSQKSLRPKAKDVFYRALRHCPWSKEIMMQAFTTLVRTMESGELKSVYETMASKGLRVHVELDDFLRQHELQRANKRRAR